MTPNDFASAVAWFPRPNGLTERQDKPVHGGYLPGRLADPLSFMAVDVHGLTRGHVHVAQAKRVHPVNGQTRGWGGTGS